MSGQDELMRTVETVEAALVRLERVIGQLTQALEEANRALSASRDLAAAARAIAQRAFEGPIPVGHADHTADDDIEIEGAE